MHPLETCAPSPPRCPHLKVTPVIPAAVGTYSEAKRVPRKVKQSVERGVSGTNEGKRKPGINVLRHKCNLSFS